MGRLLLGLYRCLIGGVVASVAAPAAPVSTVVTLGGMDVAYRGQPFVWGPINAADSTLTLDYAYQGSPFCVVIT